MQYRVKAHLMDWRLYVEARVHSKAGFTPNLPRLFQWHHLTSLLRQFWPLPLSKIAAESAVTETGPVWTFWSPSRRGCQPCLSGIWHQHEHKLHNLTSHSGSCYVYCVGFPRAAQPMQSLVAAPDLVWMQLQNLELIVNKSLAVTRTGLFAEKTTPRYHFNTLNESV